MSLMRRLEALGGAHPATPEAPEAPEKQAQEEKPEKPPEKAVAPPPPARSRIETAAPQGAKGGIRDLKSRVQARLIKEMDPKLDVNDHEKVREVVLQLFEKILTEEGQLLPRNERTLLFDAILAEIIGFGPIQPLLDDESVSEVMVNGPNKVFVERKGKLELTEVRFDDEGHVRRII